MAVIIELPIHNDKRGSLVSIEKCLPFEVKRTYFIYDIIGDERGGHRHKICKQALVAIKGSCIVHCNDGINKKKFIMDSPHKILILEPKDWHKMYKFDKNTILLILASHYYDINDYIYEDYI
jgi:hypothetical protein